MDDILADKWIAALRSGKYTQTTNALRADDRFCCLGVLCDISNKGKWSTDRGRDYSAFVFENETCIRKDLEGMHAAVGLNSDSGDIPLWRNMRRCMGDVLAPKDSKDRALEEHDEHSVAICLAELNDSGFSFNQIADVIDYFRKDL
jgi:hypothetical protein